MMYKILIIVAVISVLFGAGYRAGGNAEKAGQADDIFEAQEVEAVKVNEIIKWKERTKVVYREKIKTIRVAADPTGCLDNDLRAVGLGRMLITND